MLERFMRALADLVVRRYLAILVVLFGLGAAALYGASHLTINSNQIDLLDQNLKPIQELKRITKMTGGTGFLFLALKGDDKDHLKAVADHLGEAITNLKAPDGARQVKKVVYKQDATSYIRDNILLFLKPQDLDEVRKRIKKKIKSQIRKENPFAIELVERGPYELTFDDLVAKYRSIIKKGIEDDYYISRDLARYEDKTMEERYTARHMQMLLIRPEGDATDLEFTKALIDQVDGLIAAFNQDNAISAVLKEGYRRPAEGATVTYGYTGGYKLNLDDYETIRDSLVPTSAIALTGILVLLLVFLRRPSFVAILMGALLYGVLLTFGIASIPQVVGGKLNVITTVMGCILQGLGIDYGIHLLYRLREEYVLTEDLSTSIREAIVHSGSACAATALTTAAAFFVMSLSEFKGFSDFGILAGIGVVLIALTTYIVVPVVFLCVARVFPGFPRLLLTGMKDTAKEDIEELTQKRFPMPRLVLALTAVVTIGLGFLAKTAATDFDFNARSLMVADQPSIILQQEINDRFGISSDPVGVYTETREQYEKLFKTIHPDSLLPFADASEVPDELKAQYGDRFAGIHPVDRSRFDSIDTVMSMYTTIPDAAQQQENLKTIARMQKDFEKVKRGNLEPKEQEAYDAYEQALAVKAFDFETTIPLYGNEYRAVPEVRDEFPGWLTFIYPKVALWDGRDLLTFDEEVGVIEAEDGEKFYSTGMAILFAKLASIVLSDGRRLTGLTFLVVFGLVYLNFRKLGATLIALLPLVCGVIWMLGLMRVPVLWGAPPLRLNFINVVVLTLIFGYGIDTGIHLYHRFTETGSVMRAVRMTGGAVMASMLTAIVGWGALSFAQHRGLMSMGLLACIGIASALFVSLTLMPAILQLIADRRPPIAPLAAQAPTAQAPTAQAPTAQAPTAQAPTAQAPGASA